MKTTSTTIRSPQQIKQLILVKSIVLGIARHWFLFLSLLVAVWVFLPWLAPVFMELGWTSAGKAVYFLYSFQCHQLPERSYFLFGEKLMYSLAEIGAAWQNTTNPLILRQFIGNSEMGWKVAWSDRMVWMYSSILLGALIYGIFGNRLKPLSFSKFAILLLPMVIDGGTHMMSDIQGIGEGFRDTNTWLQILTNNAFSPAFYAGDALGSFNSWMRLITGLLFGTALVGFVYPYLNDIFAEIVRRSEATHMKGFAK